MNAAAIRGFLYYQSSITNFQLFFAPGICSFFSILAIGDLFISFLPVKEKK
jgi:hypothetical protein